MPLSNDTEMYQGVHKLTRNDSIKLLLNSIAALNNNVAKLIDAEIEKIRLVVDEGEYNRLSSIDIISIYQTINRVLRNTMNLQMLLQVKLDDILSAVLGNISVSAASNRNMNARHNALDKDSAQIGEKRKKMYVSVV